MPHVAAAFLLLVVAVLLAGGPASAHRLHAAEVVGVADHQRILVRVMHKDLMLLSLGVDPQQALSSLRHARASFEELLAETEGANSELLAQSTTVPVDLLDRHAETKTLWQEFDVHVRAAMASRRVAAAEVETLRVLANRLGASMDSLYEGYREAANHYGVTSVLGRAIEAGSAAQASSQWAFAEFFALARGGAGDPMALDAAMTAFDRRLEGLIDGDPEIGLLPAPTREIRNRLIDLQLGWHNVKPALRAAMAGETVGPSSVDAAARTSVDLLDGLSEVRLMLAALMPEGQRIRPRRFSDPESANDAEDANA